MEQDEGKNEDKTSNRLPPVEILDPYGRRVGSETKGTHPNNQRRNPLRRWLADLDRGTQVTIMLFAVASIATAVYRYEDARRAANAAKPVMSFDHAECPSRVDTKAATFETIFWFQNTGGRTARSVRVSHERSLLISPEPVNRICNDWPMNHNITAGITDVAPGHYYQLRFVVASAITAETYEFWDQASIDWTDGTDGETLHADFCQHMIHDPDTRAVRWFSCIGKPLPACTVIPVAPAD